MRPVVYPAEIVEMKAMKLTERQREVLEWITSYQQAQGRPTTVRELAAHMGVRSSSAFDTISALRKKGFLTDAEGKARALSPTAHAAKEGECLYVPLLGRIAAGTPLFAAENLEGSIPVPAPLARGRRLYALKVTGESMTGAGILDGDIAVVAHQQTADNGDIVVALIGEEATIKRFYQQPGGMVRLKPENRKFKEIIVSGDDVLIQGKLVAIQRNLA
jgi:repressor LexA